MRRRRLRLAALIAATIACGGLAAAQSEREPVFDFMTTRFESLEIAARLPSALRVAPGSFVATAVLKSDGEVRREQTLTLIQGDPAAIEELAEAVGPAPEGRSETVVLRPAPSAIAALESIRESITTAKAEGRTGAFSINVESDSLCRVEGAPIDDLLVDLFLKTSESGGFVALARDADLRALFADEPAFLDEMEVCAGAADG